MKVFISWSGELSKRLGAEFRDWLPGVIQFVKPYFTPNDIEKGSRWANDIAKELDSSSLGIFCITQDNLHSDWLLFEAGAISRKVDKSYVCPILFGLSNTDVTGPLKQLQATEFNKSEVFKLIKLINKRLGENHLPQKTLESVFDKWWPELKERIEDILEDTESPNQPIRSDRELLEEILELSRINSTRTAVPKVAVISLAKNFIHLHNEQKNMDGDYQEALNTMKKMRKPLWFILKKFSGSSDDVDEVIEEFNMLDYIAKKDDDDGLPF